MRKRGKELFFLLSNLLANSPDLFGLRFNYYDFIKPFHYFLVVGLRVDKEDKSLAKQRQIQRQQLQDALHALIVSSITTAATEEKLQNCCSELLFCVSQSSLRLLLTKSRFQLNGFIKCEGGTWQEMTRISALEESSLSSTRNESVI